MASKLMLFMLLLVLGNSCRQGQELVPFELTGKTMGSTYSVKYFSFSGDDDRVMAQQEIEKILLRINQLMSVHLPDSEISRFNADRSGQWMELSPETFMVVARAQKISELSQGSFDITVGPLVNLWGFGPDGQRKIPTDAQIQKLLQQVGYTKLELDLSQRKVRKKDPQLEINLSAIAKGYGVDVVASYLDQIQARSYLVEIGGEVKARGKKGAQKWKVAIESPSYQERKINLVLEIQDLAVATSGDYRNFQQDQGKYYSHTIDPVTGRPVEHTMGSVSVFANSCILADAYATAFMAMGPERALALANEKKIAAYFILRQGEELVAKGSEQFKILFPNII